VITDAQCAPLLIAWYLANKRDLPFRRTDDPYCIWVSEIMAQQTRMTALLPYYERFVKRFPDIDALASAEEGDVLKAWEGLGYYSRARNLHRAARIVKERYGGAFPCDHAKIRELPGIGEYTAGAILSIAFDRPVPAVDGNVLRVFARLDGIEGLITNPENRRRITETVGELLRQGSARVLTQALMELGALVCVPGTPRCEACPVAELCRAYAAGRQNELPVLPVKGKPVVEHRIIAILCCKGCMLVRQRVETMLKHLWEYPGISYDPIKQKPEQALRQWLDDFDVKYNRLTILGSARHVFTHRIWEMTGYKIEAEDTVEIPGCRWVDRETLETLAFPAALKHFHKSSPLVIP